MPAATERGERFLRVCDQERMSMDVRVVLADDHQLMREGLRALLEKRGFEIVGEAPDGRAAVKLARKLSPHVVVMDVAMRDLNGIEAARQIVSEAPGVRVLALSMHRDRQFVARMLEAGASGYLLKDDAAAELARAIREVAEGRTYLSPKIAGIVVADYVERLREGREVGCAELTPREREVLQLVAEGHTMRKVAKELSLSVKTVETHRRHIMDKLNIHTAAGLTRYAIQAGLVSVE